MRALIDSLITLFLILAIYKVIEIRKPDVNWGAASSAVLYLNALRYQHKLSIAKEHVKNFRPAYLVLCGELGKRPYLTTFASQMAGDRGLVTCGNIIVREDSAQASFSKDVEKWYVARSNTYLTDNKVRATHPAMDP